MAKRDYYDVLGVSKNASADQIKKAYRRLARQYHPDTAGKDAGATDEKFKEVQEAYDILSDAEKKTNYDRFGHADPHMGAGGWPGGHPGAGPGQWSYRTHSSGPSGQGIEFDLSDLFGGGAGAGGMGDVFEQLRGRRGGRRSARGPAKGQDIEHTVQVSFDEAIKGTTRDILTTIQSADGNMRRERLSIKIPAGINDGGKVRLRGKGQPGHGGNNGDLIITVKVAEHPYFERDGNDLVLEVPVTITEAAMGTKIDVPTLDGQTTVTIPAGTSSGRKLRLKGKGIPSHRSKEMGDMYLRIKIVVPEKLDDRSKELLSEFSKMNPQDDIRKKWR